MSGFDCGIRTSLKSSALTLPPVSESRFFILLQRKKTTGCAGM